MKDAELHLAVDLKALQYTDALETGDLDTAAALWDEASRDPRLEHILAELDGAFFAEAAGQAGRPGDASNQRPARWRWALGLSGVIAASVFAYIAWPAHEGGVSRSIPPANGLPQVVVTPPRGIRVEVAAWRQYRRVLDGEEVPAFTWPVQGDVAELGIRLDRAETGRPRDRDQSL